MALCTSCGSEVADSSSFCTSCGKPMPAATQPAASVTAPRIVCSACGLEVEAGSLFCTNCGQRLSPQSESVAPQQPARAPEPTATVAPITPIQPAGEKIPGIAAEPTQPAEVREEPAAIPPAREPAIVVPSLSTESYVAPPSPRKEAYGAPAPQALEAAPRVAAPLYAAPADYASAQPRGGAFRVVLLVLFLVIVAGGFGGWYFWGVETVIVCSPPDAQVFLDDQLLTPASYGRYVLPHLSRKPHLLRVQRAGFADTIQRLDFPLSSSREWVNITLLRSRDSRSPR